MESLGQVEGPVIRKYVAEDSINADVFKDLLFRTMLVYIQCCLFKKRWGMCNEVTRLVANICSETGYDKLRKERWCVLQHNHSD
jgi:hypothetical protein